MSRLVAAYGLYYIDNQPVVLRLAELPYAGLARERWAPTIARLRGADCQGLLLPIPWSWHEPQPGRVDFHGETDPRRDLAGLLAMAQAHDLLVVARPGPRLPQGGAAGGYPAWLPDAIPDALARRPDGSAGAADGDQVYSLRHPQHLAQVTRWYRAVAGVLQPFLGTVVCAWRLDDLAGEPFAATVGRLDFNPDTVARYRTYLQERYEDEASLSREWGYRVSSFFAVQPPVATRPWTWGELNDWQAFLEQWVASYVGELRRIVRSLNVDVPLVASAPAGPLSPGHSLARAGAGDFSGFDLLAGAGGQAGMRRGENGGQPFAGSLRATQFQTVAADVRPLTCWWLEMAARGGPPARTAADPSGRRDGGAEAALLQELAGAVAHGLKGYALGWTAASLLEASGGEEGGEGPLVRFQRLLADREEELTASVEAHDPIAYLDYLPYRRLTPFDLDGHGRGPDPARLQAWPSLEGFHALLLTAGYNPVRLDLEQAADETLAEYRLAVFPSRGYLDLDSYGKLVIFVLRGGSLLTFPEPATRQLDGTPFNASFLWPHRAAETGAVGTGPLGRMLSRLAGRRAATPAAPPGCGPERVDASHAFRPRWLLPAAGVRLRRPARGRPGRSGRQGDEVRGDVRLVEFPDAGAPVARYGTGSIPGHVRKATGAIVQAEVLLRRGTSPVAYRIQVRDGVSTVVGTVLGGAYVTPDYTRLSPTERLALRRFAVDLVAQSVARRLVPDDTLEVEAVARLSPDGGCLLFVINRLGAQAGDLHLPDPGALNLDADPKVQVLYSAYGSQAEACAGGVRLSLAPLDVLVARLW